MYYNQIPTAQCSPNNTLAVCMVRRKHLFKDRLYYLQLTISSLTLSDGHNAKCPKYIFQLNINTIFQWLIENDQLIGFKLPYQGSKKDFFGKQSDLLYLKQKMGNLVLYENVSVCYSLEKHYQKGTFGKVHFDITQVIKGICKFNQKEFAIKQLDIQKSSSQLIKNEIQILKTIANHQSPNVLEIKEIYKDQYSYYIVTEYINCLNLQQHLHSRKTPFSETEALFIIQSTLSGLQQIHNAGIIHRDLKPANLMYDSNQVKIIDFGLACFNGKQLEQFPTCGTIGYSAPEVFKATKKSSTYNSKVDIFSIGCIFYELLTLKPLFTGNKEFCTQYNNEHCLINIYQQGQVFDLVKLFLKEDPLQRIDSFQALKLVKKCIEVKSFDVNTWYKMQFKQLNSPKNSDVDFFQMTSSNLKIYW